MTDKKALIKSFADRIRNDSVRITIGNDESGYSGQWAFWTNKADLYFGVRSIAGLMKVSLHQSGVCRVAFTKQFADTLEDKQLPRGGNRAFTVWRRPETPASGALLVASILFPTAFLCCDPPPKKKLNMIMAPASKDAAIELGLFFHRVSPDDIADGFAKMGTPYVSCDLGENEWVSFVFRETPFDAKGFAEMVKGKWPGKATASREFQPGESIDANMLILNDPKEEGHLCICEAGNVIVSKSEEATAEKS